MTVGVVGLSCCGAEKSDELVYNPPSTFFLRLAHAHERSGDVTETSLKRLCLTHRLTVMAKRLGELKKMQRGQLARINKDELIDSILSAQEADDTPMLKALEDKLNAVMTEVAELRRTLTSPESVLAGKFEELHERVDKQAEIIAKQQRYLEMLDRKDREMNLVVLGLPDEYEALDGATTDADKVNRVWDKMGVGDVQCQLRRLGALPEGQRRNRPLLLTIRDQETRLRVLAAAKHLKTSGEKYSKIYVKKDVHPGVRKEWRRLREAEERERERPENVGSEIRLNTRERKLYRDDVVIDSWNPQVFY